MKTLEKLSQDLDKRPQTSTVALCGLKLKFQYGKPWSLQVRLNPQRDGVVKTENKASCAELHWVSHWTAKFIVLDQRGDL